MRRAPTKPGPAEDAELIDSNTAALARVDEALRERSPAEAPPMEAAFDVAPAEPPGPRLRDDEPHVLGMFAVGALIAFLLMMALETILHGQAPRPVPVMGPTPAAGAPASRGPKVAAAQPPLAAERRATPERFLEVRPGWRWQVGADGLDRVSGAVFNGSLRTATAWRATVLYLDAGGRPIAAFSTTAVSPLPPGGTARFQLFHRHLPGAVEAEVVLSQAAFR